MSDIVIQAENLGKHDTTGHQAEKGRDAALREETLASTRTNRGHSCAALPVF
jgi:hypothetical protein